MCNCPFADKCGYVRYRSPKKYWIGIATLPEDGICDKISHNNCVRLTEAKPTEHLGIEGVVSQEEVALAFPKK